MNCYCLIKFALQLYIHKYLSLFISTYLCNPSATSRWFFQWSTAGLNSKFSYVLSRLKKPVCPIMYPLLHICTEYLKTDIVFFFWELDLNILTSLQLWKQ